MALASALTANSVLWRLDLHNNRCGGQPAPSGSQTATGELAAAAFVAALGDNCTLRELTLPLAQVSPSTKAEIERLCSPEGLAERRWGLARAEAEGRAAGGRRDRMEWRNRTQWRRR